MNESNLLTLIGINATILAITMAALGIFTSLITERKLDVLECIGRVRREVEALFPVQWYFPGELADEKYNSDCDVTRKRLLQELSALAGGFQDPTLASTNDSPGIGKHIITRLLSLVHHYPFARVIEKLPDGTHIFRKRPLIGDQSAKLYLKWARDFEEVMTGIDHLDNNYRGMLIHRVLSFQKESDANLKKDEQRKYVEKLELELEKLKHELSLLDKPLSQYTEDELNKLRRKENLEEQVRDERFMVGPDYKRAFDEIFKRFKMARENVLPLASDLQKLNYYDSKPTLTQKAILSVSVALTIFLGTTLPMLHLMLSLPYSNEYMYIVYGFIPLFMHIITALTLYWIMQM